MGKFVFIFLCFFIVVVFGSTDQNSNSDSTENEIPKELQKKMRELEKFHEEFKSFKSSFVQLGAAFGHFHQSLTKNGTGSSGDAGQTAEVRSTTPSTPQELETPAPQSKSMTSCSDAMEILPSPRSQKQTIYPHENGKSLEVLCDFETDGGGWTTIQKRPSGPKYEFYQIWTEYSNGFGSLDGNFWLGLENIHTLTKNGDQELRIEVEDFDGNKRYARYSSFSVSDASDFYRLSISGYSGDSTLNDDMNYPSSGGVLNGMRFSTLDKDNDKSTGNCANDYLSGWWFNNCGAANLNGLYFEKGETVPYANGIIWSSWKGWNYSLAKTEMKIRKRK